MPGPITPGIDQHIFDFGQHLGQKPDLGGVDPADILMGRVQPPQADQTAPWDQPFQNPYVQGMDSPYAAGAMGPEAGQEMGYGPPQGMVGPQMPPPQGMGGEDPNAQQGGMPPSGHPFWQQAGEYLSSDRFKDSLMSGIIAGQMATNPQGALQLAMQWRQHRDQRAWQAQQNQLQRDAMVERNKEAQKAKKEVSDARKQSGKLHLAQSKAFQLGVSIPEWEGANNTPLDETNVDDFLGYASNVEQERKQAAADAKKQKDEMAQMNKVLGNIAKGMPVGKTPWDGRPEWEPIKTAAQERGKVFLATGTALKEAQLANSRLETQLKAEELKNKKATGGGTNLKYRQAVIEMNDAFGMWKSTKDEIEKLQKSQADQLGVVEYGELLDSKIMALPDLQKKYELARDKARELTGGKEEGSTTPTGPSDKAKAGFAYAYRNSENEETKKMLLDSWKEQYGEDAPVPVGN